MRVVPLYTSVHLSGLHMSASSAPVAVDLVSTYKCDESYSVSATAETLSDVVDYLTCCICSM